MALGYRFQPIYFYQLQFKISFEVLFKCLYHKCYYNDDTYIVEFALSRLKLKYLKVYIFYILPNLV